MGTRSSGKVKWFNAVKGFGFIIPDDGTAEIFVHQTALKADGFRSLREDETVEYEVDASDNKPKAVNVTGPAGANVLGAVRRRRRGKATAKADEEDTQEN